MSAVREKTKEELFDDLVVALIELEALRAKWDAIPWDALRAMKRTVQRSGVIDPDDAEDVDIFLDANAPQEPQND